MSEPYSILVVNLGSTSTKVSFYLGEELVHANSISHSSDELQAFSSIWDQYDCRRQVILAELARQGRSVSDFHIISCRGGNCKPVPGGIYRVTPPMLDAMRTGRYGVHPTCVGNLICYDLGREYGVPVITVDPPVTDEYCDSARYTGIPQIRRLSSFHALNQKATARKVAEKLGRPYDQCRFVVAHMGGGISVGAHRDGLVVDVNNALDGDGPFSPERAGTIPNAALIRLCFSNEYTQQELLRMMTGKGGLMAHLGTNDAREVERRIDQGDHEAQAVYTAMAYQTVKEIGAMAAVLEGRVDALCFTGSLVRSEFLMGYIKPRVAFVAPIYEIPGENEMEALAAGAVRYLTGQEALRVYEE